MAGGRAWQLRLGQAGGLNRGEGGSSWRRKNVLLLRRLKPFGRLKNLLQSLKLFRALKLFKSLKSLFKVESVTPKLT